MGLEPEVADADELQAAVRAAGIGGAGISSTGKRHQTFFLFLWSASRASRKRDHAVGKCHESMV